MTEGPPADDEERLDVGLDPLDDEVLSDLDDLRRILRRVGREADDGIPTTDWDDVAWSCPRNDCAGRLGPVDTRVQGLGADPDDLDVPQSQRPVSADTLDRARALTLPIVRCGDCEAVYQSSFRRLVEPDERTLPEPAIVETPGTLGGRPRIDGTRIGVEHVTTVHETGYTAEEISKEVYPHLSVEHVRMAIEWADAHPERMAAIERENAAIRYRHRLLDAAVEGAVAESIETLWSVMVEARAAGEADPEQVVANLLVSGFRQAAGLDVTVDTESDRVIIDVADAPEYPLDDGRNGAIEADDDRG